MRNVLVDGRRADAQGLSRFAISHFLVVVESEDALVLLCQVLVDDSRQFVQQFVPFLCLMFG